MVLTKQVLDNGMSRNGGWSAKQIRSLGVDDEITGGMFKKGWKKRITGLDIPEENIKRFLALKDSHLPDGSSLF